MTKITGEKVYTLLDEVRFYDSKKAPALDFSVKPEPGKMFLANDSGAISIISATQNLAWLATDEELERFIRAKSSPLNALFDQNE